MKSFNKVNLTSLVKTNLATRLGKIYTTVYPLGTLFQEESNKHKQTVAVRGFYWIESSLKLTDFWHGIEQNWSIPRVPVYRADTYNTGPFSETNNLHLFQILWFFREYSNYNYIMSELCNLISFNCHKEKGNTRIFVIFLRITHLISDVWCLLGAATQILGLGFIFSRLYFLLQKLSRVWNIYSR